MITCAVLGVRALLDHRRLAGLMALTVAISLAAFLILRGYQAGLAKRYIHLSSAHLLVEKSGSIGEFTGSRIPAQVGAQLLALGASQAVPEIYSVVGLTPDDAVLLRGISLEKYTDYESFRILSGRPLQPGDPPRLVMIGVRLAEERGLNPGDILPIRGRDFQVTGIFDIGGFADFQAWISLEDAQQLMGWGSDVSVFIIPAGEKLKQGDELDGGLSVIRKGETGINLVAECRPLFDLLELVTLALGAAAAVSLANVLGRLVWLHRRDLAILLSLGFGRPALSAYLLAQGSAIGAAGFLSGCAAAFVLGALTQIRTAGISIQAVFDWNVLGGSLVFALVLTLTGCLLPVVWLAKTNLVELLRSES